jgi:DNA invertase Pin-like site-specific DNA recombinase
LGRSLPHLVDVVGALSKQGIHFKSISDGVIDTTTASGELIFHIFAALAQFERSLIRERTRKGLEAARARGRKGGRRKIQADNPKVVMAKKMHADKTLEIDEICATLKISRATFYRYLQL